MSGFMHIVIEFQHVTCLFQVQLFLTRLNAGNIGVTVAGLFVIDKSMIVTVSNNS